MRILLVVGMGAGRAVCAEAAEQQADEPPLPVTIIEGPVTTIRGFLAYGPWHLPARGNWHGTPAPLPLADGLVQWAQLEKPPFNAIPRLAGDASGGVDFAPFAGAADNWKGNHLLLLACKVIANERTAAVLDMANGDNVHAYANGKYLGVVTNAVPPRGGQFHPIPVPLKKGANILLFKLVATRAAPRFKVNIITDGSRDFDTAWRRGDGLLTRLVYSPEHPREKPSVQWLPSLGNMTVRAVVTDVFSGRVSPAQTLRRGDALRLGEDDGEVLAETGKAMATTAVDAADTTVIKGAYSVRFQNENGRGEEQFVVGEPRKLGEQLEAAVKRLCNNDAKTRINAETLLRRLDILCAPENYKPDDYKWREKAAYAICSLAGLVGALERGVPDPARDAPGLHLRGFASSLDISTQHYRLYIPSSYKRGQKLPLLVILPTTISASRHSFIESPFIANHRDAAHMARVAEKHGFALLWSGYRNAPAGLPCEDAHLDEVLKAVQADYDLDLQRIHLYGVCSGGILAGNAAARWPGRFASIIYNRAIFSRLADQLPGLADGQHRWLRITDPTDALLRDKAISIFLTNTENADEGHGEIELSHEFLAKAANFGKPVTADFSPPPVDDTHWDRVFQWASSARLEFPGGDAPGPGASAVHEGPVREVFGTPVVIVQGTLGSAQENEDIRKFCALIQRSYKEYFYLASCKIIKDTELDGDVIRANSLILTGGAETNGVWKRFADREPFPAAGGQAGLDGRRLAGRHVYHAVCRSPVSSDRYLLFLGGSGAGLLKHSPVRAIYEGDYDYALWRIDGIDRRLVAMRSLGNQPGQK